MTAVPDGSPRSAYSSVRRSRSVTVANTRRRYGPAPHLPRRVSDELVSEVGVRPAVDDGAVVGVLHRVDLVVLVRGDPPNYPMADAIASQNTVWSPANWCGPCSITCSLRKFPWASNVATIERNPASFTKVLLCEV